MRNLMAGTTTAGTDFDVSAAADSLGVRPETALRIMQLTADPSASTTAIVEVVDADPTLAARTLKLANSSFYGMSHRIGRIDRAVAMLGQAAVAKLAASASISSAFQSIHIDAPGIGKNTPWRYSVSVAYATETVVHECHGMTTVACNKLLADSFVIGLIHDIGTMVQAKRDPQAFGEAVSASLQSGVPLVVHERRLMGIDHADIGARLALHWKLPPEMAQGIGHHNDPLAADADFRTITCVVHSAAQLVRRAGVPSLDGDADMEHLAAAMDHLRIDTRNTDKLVDAIKTRVEKTPF